MAKNKRNELADAVKKYNKDLTAKLHTPKKVTRAPIPPRAQVPQRTNSLIPNPNRFDFWRFLEDHYIIISIVITIIIFAMVCAKGKI